MNQNRKLQIIQTAAKMFKEQGYNAVSMRDLASELGIKASSLYNHIDSKEDILAEIIMDLAHSFTQHIQQVKKEKCSVVDKLKKIISMHVQTTLIKTDYLACMNKEWKYLGENRQKEYLKLRKNYELDFKAVIEEGIRNKELKDRNPKVTASIILSALRTIYHWINTEDFEDRKQIEEIIIQHLLWGIVE